MPKKREAPTNCYWRGETLWGRLRVAGREVRWSLRTRDAATALRRIEARRRELDAELHYGEVRQTYEAVYVAWAAHIAHQVGPRTAARYAVSLKQIEGFLRPLDAHQIDRDVVADIVRARRAAGVSTATIRRDLSALSSVLAFAEDEGWRDNGNPALERLRRLKERRDPIVLPEPADIEAVIARAPGNFAHMIRCAWLTGCRQAELATAERRRVNHRTRQITVIGKGNKLRVIQLSAEAYASIAMVPPHLGSPWLFWHGVGEPYANVASRFASIVASAQKRAQDAGREFRAFRFHDLRHRFAVDYLRTGGNLYDLKGHLGHRSVGTTELYLAFLTPEEARAAKFDRAVGAHENGHM